MRDSTAPRPATGSDTTVAQLVKVRDMYRDQLRFLPWGAAVRYQTYGIIQGLNMAITAYEQAG